MGLIADRAIVGAKLRTLDPVRPSATALAMRDGIIIAVGNDAEIRETCDGKTELVDARGSVIIPGLVDAHQHPFHGAEDTAGVDLDGIATIDALRDALRAERRRIGPAAFLRGHSLAYAVFATQAMHHELIDDAVGGNAYLTFYDFHTALASESALRAAGISGPQTFTDASEIVCRDGRPTGELREAGALKLVYATIPALTAAEKRTVHLAALARMHACGITGVHAMDGTPDTLELCQQYEADGDLTMRLVIPLTIEPSMSANEQTAWLVHRDTAGRLWRGAVAKFFIDGVVEPGTAWLLEADTNGASQRPFWPDPAFYAESVARFAQAGFQCVTHAIGDRAVRCALDAYRAAGAPRRGPHRVEHIETAVDTDIARFAQEGVVASMQMSHLQWMRSDGSDPWTQVLGPERAARGFRSADLLDSGATLALGSDWPVARFDPREGLAWAQLRRLPLAVDRLPLQPAQRLTGEQALAGYTTGAAAAVGDGDVAGRIRVGFRADLTGFADDPVTCAPDQLPALPVTLTVTDGKVVHRGLD